MNTHKKHSLYSSDWEKQLKLLVGKKVDHLFKKGEPKLVAFELKGDLVSNEAGETIQVNQAELKIAERKKLVMNC